MSRALPLRKKCNSGIRSFTRSCKSVFSVMFDEDTGASLSESVPRAVFVLVGFRRHYRRYELRLSELRKFISIPNLSERRRTGRRRVTPFISTQALRLWWCIPGAGRHITGIAHGVAGNFN